MTIDSPKDRRTHPRVPIELKVEYRRLNTFFADYTKNICKGGTFIRTRKPLAVGTRFVFKLYVPKLEEPLVLTGEVRWVVRENEPPPPGVPANHEPGMGIQFVYSSEAERRRVHEIVEKLMIESLGPLLSAKLIGKDPEPET